ncbi:MAG: heat-inducible transcription repressor HrcA [Gammaproteobacteria bacterium]|nr:heat-inducible transcription repressor HrcA [Gammaproteobacteria bacterium]
MSAESGQSSATALSERGQHLLRVLVQTYIGDGRPVGSQTLLRAAAVDLSPATIRSVMADLEDRGLIYSPHASAGRIPTVKGYRLFIDTMLRVLPLHDAVIDQLKERLSRDLTPHSLVEAASDMLSGITRLAGVVTVPRQEHASLRQIEFLGLSENRVLAILVMNQHEVQNRVIQLDRAYSESELREAANYLNAKFAGRGMVALRRELLAELDAVREDMNCMMRSAIELGEKAFASDERVQDDFVVVGQTNLMGYEQLSDVDKLRQLFDAFSTKRDILHLLDKCICARGVQIFVGQESGYQVLDECSVVSAPYSVQGDVIGVLGVIGPTRMPYDRVIPIVDITARLLGAALNTRSRDPT